MSQPLSNFGPILEHPHKFRGPTSVDSEVLARGFIERVQNDDDFVAADIDGPYLTVYDYITFVTVIRQKRPTADQPRTIGRAIDPAPLNPAEQAEAVDRLVDAAPGSVESMMGWLAVCRALFPQTRLSPETA